MAGHGPAAAPPGTAQRRNKSSTKASLKLAVDHDVPALPPAEDWFPADPLSPAAQRFPTVDPDTGALAWPPPVQRWWNDIWSSPMSNEFVHSDIQGLYMAAFYLAQALNPYAKMSDRLAAGKAHEACIRNYGLNPMARRTLQWEIERTKEAQERGAKRRASTHGKGPDGHGDARNPVSAPDPRQNTENGSENPFSVVN